MECIVRIGSICIHKYSMYICIAIDCGDNAKVLNVGFKNKSDTSTRVSG